MEPVSLTCPKCATSWKLIKAGTGPITCPQCKAPLDSPARVGSEQPAPGNPSPAPVEVRVAAARPPSQPIDPIPGITPTAALPPMDIPDTDDPGLQADFDDRHEQPDRRRGMHPLLKVTIILLSLMILLPVAVVVLFLTVCAMMIYL